jgi:purine-binding chemotaxis protein CheW
MSESMLGSQHNDTDNGRSGTGVPSSTATYVTFCLGSQTFGVEVTDVREILDLQTLYTLPQSLEDCEGVIDTRGESIPVINLARRLGLAGGERGADTRIIVFEIAAHPGRRAIGVLADTVLDVEQIADDEIEPAPRAAFSGGGELALRGLARLQENIVVLLDIDRVFGAGLPDLDA